eukprot:TRINITY_DN20545_c0_g2_i2.p1 TRINITY_DN20545_c0_g2~~TRINITY_DN20545_c0_g2_i2.p1  ORF type:complete len:388 (-),score=56.20 TRINITY_DN20545_c0_g2_i2:264-1346(-)
MVRLPSGALRRRAPVSDVGFQKRSVSDFKMSLGSERLELPGYHIESAEMLGSGGYGVVRLVRPRAKGQPKYAVKTVAKHRDNLQGPVEAMHEAEILKRLDHPNVCRMLEAFEDDYHIHLALEYIHGHELFYEIEDCRPVAPLRAAVIAQQVFEALAHCHVQGVIHRDVKPENIMVTHAADGGVIRLPRVVLIDFGLALECPPGVESVAAPVAGTREFMAPEVVSDGLYSGASDVWAAGVMLFMLLSGGLSPPIGESSRDCCEDLDSAAIGAVRDLLRSQAALRPRAAEVAGSAWIRGALVLAAGVAEEVGTFASTAVSSAHAVTCRHLSAESDDCRSARGDAFQCLPQAFRGGTLVACGS